MQSRSEILNSTNHELTQRVLTVLPQTNTANTNTNTANSTTTHTPATIPQPTTKPAPQLALQPSLEWRNRRHGHSCQYTPIIQSVQWRSATLPPRAYGTLHATPLLSHSKELGLWIVRQVLGGEKQASKHAKLKGNEDAAVHYLRVSTGTSFG